MNKDIYKSIVVFCSSNDGDSSAFLLESYAIGKALAEQETTLFCISARIGLIGKVAQGVFGAEGKVMGIMSGFLKKEKFAITNYCS